MCRNLFSHWLTAVLLVAVAGAPMLCRAENYAFLVAVQDYDVKDLKPLQFTRSDILEFAKVLEKSGFKADKMVVMTDKSEQRRYLSEAEKIRAEFELLLAGIKEGDTLVVAFSGHGVQFEGDPKNYFCPVDADLEDPKHGKLIALSEIYERLKECPAEKRLLLVDACRKEPLSPVKKARQTVSLKSVTRPQTEAVPKGVVAVFSCSAGQESYEWPDLKHGVFFYHVLEAWNGAADSGDRKITLNQVINYATDKTTTFARLTLKAPQVPHVKSDFEGTWVLRKLEKSIEALLPAIAPFDANKAKQLQQDWAKHYRLPVELTNKTGVTLRLIPPGEFEMGAPASDKEAERPERPLHLVRIEKAFYLGKYEVTQKEWKAVMKTEPWKRKSFVKEGAQYPATYVSWNEANEFCRRISRTEGKLYRLPTEAEWEYACRAGTTTRFSFGNDERELGDYAWYGAVEGNGNARNELYAHQVGLKRPNPFGLHDMPGNVYEWCSDWFGEKYYEQSPSKDPRGPETGSARQSRGGCWRDGPERCFSSSRHASDNPSVTYSGRGFRVAAVAVSE